MRKPVINVRPGEYVTARLGPAAPVPSHRARHRFRVGQHRLLVEQADLARAVTALRDTGHMVDEA
ncbi:hypothetical protein [Saccharomonospora sp.]|uniref:hypothetical protein n=1 Tax=Saccharomonospora sp. TaxID=33913 RepID=UPI0026173F41|nr:hypothetical protein [Saccharomonospora sp.]